MREIAVIIICLLAGMLLILIASEHREQMIHAQFLRQQQVPLVAPCITPAPQKPLRERSA